MLDILIIISPLFLIILLGAILRKSNVVDESWQKVLNNYAFKIGFPALIFFALSKTEFSLETHSQLLLVNFIFLSSVIVLFAFLGKLLRLKTKTLKTLIICIVFGNVAYLGLPVVSNTLGENTIPISSLIVSVYLFVIFTIGIIIMEVLGHEKLNLAKIFFSLIKNPLLIATILGLLFSILNLDLPEIINKSLQIISNSVTPIVLLVIGLFLGKAKFGNLKEWIPVFLFSIFTLLVVPSILFFGLKFFGKIPRNFAESVILAAMPLAITPFAFSDTYDLDSHFIAKSIALSTILSIISIPFWISLVVA